MKTSELSGFALDWAVATCEGYTPYHYRKTLKIVKDAHGNATGIQVPIQRKLVWYTPSVNWAQGGPIIERECIDVMFEGPEWYAYMRWASGRTIQYDGPTPLIAAMRCYVASKMGDEIEIPEELA